MNRIYSFLAKYRVILGKLAYVDRVELVQNTVQIEAFIIILLYSSV
jgi:hypothetical protein